MKDSSGSGLTRRSFIGSAVTVGLAAAGPRVNAGDEIGEHWDAETDVLVIGSGTGLLAALVAAKSGLRVAVLEKSPTIGGTTLVSGGMVWVPNNCEMAQAGMGDSREQALIYLERVAQGLTDNELLKAIVDNGPEMLDFVSRNTSICWRLSGKSKVSENHPTREGTVNCGRSVEVDRDDDPTTEGRHLHGGGQILIDKLMETASELGIPILVSTPARQLIVEETPEAKRVIGVLAEHDGKLLRIRARNGVLLASGGFERDADMKRHFLRGPSLYTGGAETNSGDGIRMAMALGADLRNMNSAWGITVYRADAEANGMNRGGFSLNAQLEMRHPGGICVNRQGQRFCNEAADYGANWRTYHTWQNRDAGGYLNIPAFQIFDHSVRRNFTIAECSASQTLPEWVIQADTLDELALTLRIDGKGFTETVKAFNRFASGGIDPEFHRGESPFGPYSCGAERTLKPLDEPPFYGVEVAPADIGTGGGVRVDGSARVIDVFGRAIAGLYASGNTAGVGTPGTLYGRGGALGAALTFAYIAGKSIVEAKSQVA